MMHTLKQRFLVPLAATVVAAACGMAVTYLLARKFVLVHMESELGASAVRVLAEVSSFSSQAYTVLDRMNASPYPPCSDADISNARKLLSRAELLKDVGRMSDGRIACSASLNRADIPLTRFNPQFTLPDGTKLYRGMTPYKMGDFPLISMQRGDSYVVFGIWSGSYLIRDLDASSIHFTFVVVDGPSGQAGWLVGAPVLSNGAVIDKDAKGRAGNVLYASRCSPRYSGCITAYNSVTQVLEDGRIYLTVAPILGGVFGSFFGLFTSLLYRRNHGMEQQLRRAIRKDKLRLVYQPIVELSSRRIVGAEALARWADEEGLAVSPDFFIKIAEERGFVGAITRLVVRHALRDFATTLRSRPDFRLSLNVSAADLADPMFLPMLDESLEQAKVPARSLAIEITESSTARHDLAIETIAQLRRRGYAAHIDDFGTGYSSLSYLHTLPIDAIKIDKSFTWAIGTEAVTVSILPQILAMAETLDLQVIVEGVETELQAGYFSAAARPIFAQGRYFGYPVPASAFHRLLADEEKKPAAPADAV